MKRAVTVEQLLLCETCTFTEQGRPIYRGVIARAVVPRLPADVDPFCAAIELWGPPNGRVDLGVRIEAPSGAIVKADNSGLIPLDSDGTRSLAAMFEDVRFEEEGMHAVVVLRGKRVLRRKRFLLEVDPAAERLGP